MGGGVYIQLGVWVHHPSHVTLMNFPEMLTTYMLVSFQLWLCKYLDISVTLVYILSSNWVLLKEFFPGLLCGADLAEVSGVTSLGSHQHSS